VNHREHIKRILDKAAMRAISLRQAPSLRLVSVQELDDTLTGIERRQLIRSAYALAAQRAGEEGT
jgi:hypothetical protein